MGDIDAVALAKAESYALNLLALLFSPSNGLTYYFGDMPISPSATATLSSIYIPRTGHVKYIAIMSHSPTIAGSGEAISLYFRLNNTTDTLIATVSLAQSQRLFLNSALNIAVMQGDTFEIKMVCPTWATPPQGTRFGGHLYISTGS